MKNVPYFSIPAVLFVMVCGIFLSFFPDKVEAQLALHKAWYSPRGYTLMGFITGWGEGPMFVLVIIAYALRKAWWRAGEFVAAGILSSVLVQCLKKLVFAPSPRPMGVIEWSQTLLATDLDLPLQFAFPSGHTTTAFVFFALIALHWRRPASFRRVLRHCGGGFKSLSHGALGHRCDGGCSIGNSHSLGGSFRIPKGTKKAAHPRVSGSVLDTVV